jgi:PTH1 family peptidyl-tRNA hydrolase
MKVIVGLGNPGTQYDWTPHNIGFLAIDAIAERAGIRVTRPESKSQVGVGKLAGEDVVLAKPQTFMNLSGESVGALVKFYQLAPVKILVAVDDADLPFGEIRLRGNGSSGGHHGLESIEQHLSSREFARLRIGIGIGRKDGSREITNYVLGKFDSGENELLKKVLERASDQVESWLEAGIEKAMNRFNGVVDSTNEKKKQ